MMNTADAHDLKLAVALNKEDLASYLSALISGDAAGVSAIEERNAIWRQGGAPWFDAARKIWIREPVWEHRGRVVLSDAAIEPKVEGRPGPFKIEISKKNGLSVLFGFVYSANKNPPVAWGLLMLFRREHIMKFVNNATDWHTFAITQPNTAASDARIGGLRPVALITDTMPSAPEVA